MPSTKVLKPKPVEATRKTLENSKPVRTRATSRTETELRVPAARKSRASSCPRSPRYAQQQQQQRGRGQRAPSGEPGAASRPGCARRTQSSAPKLTETGTRTNPDRRRVTSSSKQAAVNAKCTDATACAAPRTQRGVRAEAKFAIQSNKAFTVIPPNPKKRREIQRKAEAELAALEELRLSRAMAYVSINPSSVGGCMSLEEVRLKQQQEMMQAKRKHKQVKKQLMEEASVLTS